MTATDLVTFAVTAVAGHRLRALLSVVGVAIGVGAVIVLTALTDGARTYVTQQFASLGTNLVIVVPGRTETTGIPGLGGTPNDLTLEDAEALTRSVASIRRVAPIAMGTETVSHRDRARQVALIGTTPEYRLARELKMAVGEFLPAGAERRGSPVAVLGSGLSRELFDRRSPIGEVVRVGSWRMRVIGVLAPQGTKLGVDFDETVFVPVVTSMRMLNRHSLFRILVEVNAYRDLEAAREAIRRVISARHAEDDVTVITQDAVLSTFGSILDVLTIGLVAIAAVSLTVAGLGIMNVMLVSVSERSREIGLLRALGAGRLQVLSLFLTEAVLLSTTGGLLGLALGYLSIGGLVTLYPALPASPPGWAVAAALLVAIGVGVVFGLLPARRAIRLDPVAALSGR
jgi:putative ABC transport system permease protein